MNGDPLHADQRIERRRREDRALDKIDETRDDLYRHLRRAIVWLFVGVTALTVALGAAVWLGYAANRDRIHDLCESSNRQNASVRALAQDLNASPEIVAIVDRRFRDQTCP